MLILISKPSNIYRAGCLSSSVNIYHGGRGGGGEVLGVILYVDQSAGTLDPGVLPGIHLSLDFRFFRLA